MEERRKLGDVSQINSDTEEKKKRQYRELFLELSEYRMPFGKYKGVKLVELPEPYVVWFAQKGFPKGKLGDLLCIVYEIKVNGLEYLFRKSQT